MGPGITLKPFYFYKCILNEEVCYLIYVSSFYFRFLDKNFGTIISFRSTVGIAQTYKPTDGSTQHLGNVLACFYSSPSSACYSDVGQVPTRPTRVVHAPTRVNTRVTSSGLNVAKNLKCNAKQKIMYSFQKLIKPT